MTRIKGYLVLTGLYYPINQRSQLATKCIVYTKPDMTRLRYGKAEARHCIKWIGIVLAKLITNRHFRSRMLTGGRQIRERASDKMLFRDPITIRVYKYIPE